MVVIGVEGDTNIKIEDAWLLVMVQQELLHAGYKNDLSCLFLKGKVF